MTTCCSTPKARLARVAGLALIASAVSAMPHPARAQADPEAGMAWGVQLAGSFSEAEARALYERAREMLPSSIPVGAPVIERTIYASRGAAPFYRARIDVPSQAQAVALCDRIRQAGGGCVVLRAAQAASMPGP